MNDLGSRLHDLAADATADVELRNPRLAGPRRRSLRAWIAAVAGGVLAAIAGLAGVGVLSPVGEGDVSRIEMSVPTTDAPSPPTSAPTTDTTPVTTTPPTTAVTPTTSAPSPPAPRTEPATGRSSVGPPESSILARWGERGPDTAVPPNDGAHGTAGSGCRPGNVDRLPDGVWMARVTAFHANELEVDLVCYKTVASSPDEPIEDWEITDDSPRIRRMGLASDARLFLQTNAVALPGEETERRGFRDPAAAARFAAEVGDPTPTGWLLVEDGRVAELYVPPLRSA